MKVTLIDYSKHAEETIAQSAGLCYGRNDKDTKRITRLKQHKHLATFRFAHAVILVEDISRTCSHQLVRHPHLSYLQESQRYVNQADRGFVMPEVTKGMEERIKAHVEAANDLYYDLLDTNTKKEDARAILPANTMTSMYVAGNFQAWYEAIRLRTEKHAQQEIQEVFTQIGELLELNFPLAFEGVLNER